VVEGVTSLQFSQIREKLRKVDLSEPDLSNIVEPQIVDGSKLIDISKPIHGATL
jgi:DNA-binding TFAR19-related protein (PDSD5 family)